MYDRESISQRIYGIYILVAPKLEIYNNLYALFKMGKLSRLNKFFGKQQSILSAENNFDKKRERRLHFLRKNVIYS